jgi:hypothetical protein
MLEAMTICAFGFATVAPDVWTAELDPVPDAVPDPPGPAEPPGDDPALLVEPAAEVEVVEVVAEPPPEDEQPAMISARATPLAATSAPRFGRRDSRRRRVCGDNTTASIFSVTVRSIGCSQSEPATASRNWRCARCLDRAGLLATVKHRRRTGVE